MLNTQVLVSTNSKQEHLTITVLGYKDQANQDGCVTLDSADEEGDRAFLIA